MSQVLHLRPGPCVKELSYPRVPSMLIPCEADGCGHGVWCADDEKPSQTVLMVVCVHCARALLGRVGA